MACRATTILLIRQPFGTETGYASCVKLLARAPAVSCIHTHHSRRQSLPWHGRIKEALTSMIRLAQARATFRVSCDPDGVSPHPVPWRDPRARPQAAHRRPWTFADSASSGGQATPGRRSIHVRPLRSAPPPSRVVFRGPSTRRQTQFDTGRSKEVSPVGRM